MAIQVRSNDPAEQVVSASSEEQKTSAPEQSAAQEQNKAVESDTTKAEEEVVDQDNDEDSDEGEVKEDDKAKPKKKGGFQRRIDKLNARNAETERRARALEERLAQLEAGKQDAPKANESRSQEDKPRPDNFDTHAEYVEALADWKIEQREKAREAEAQRSKLENDHKAKLQAHFERVKTFAESVDDFEEAIEAVDDIPVPAALQELIFSSENGPELLYELAKNREEFERIAKLSPLACARALGRLESKIAAKPSDDPNLKPNKITKAPKPIDPVGKSSKSVVTKSLDDPNLTQAEYERLRREQMKRKYG